MMNDELQINIYRWLLYTEAEYENRYIDLLNNFNRVAHQHYLQDYLKLYEAELRLNHFKQFSKDLTKLLEIGKRS